MDLIKEKNAEISELTNKLKVLMCAVQSVVTLLKEGGSPAKVQHLVGVVLDCFGQAQSCCGTSKIISYARLYCPLTGREINIISSPLLGQ